MMTYCDKGAVLSECGTYRLLLWRRWNLAAPVLVWIMLNPSTADGHSDDRTIETIVSFASIWGYGAVEVVNLYDFRATDPKDLKRAGYPSSAENFAVIKLVIARAISNGGRIVAAWGAHARDEDVARLLADVRVPLWCLRETRGGKPGHPLYVARDTVPYIWHGVEMLT